MTTTILVIILIVLVFINILVTLTKKIHINEELKEKLIKIDSEISKIDPLIREEFGRSRNESQSAFRGNREELNNALKSFEDKFTRSIMDFNQLQNQNFEVFLNKQESIRREIEEKLKEIRETVEEKLTKIQEDNNKKLEEMRKTVDEKLEESLNRRFNESFNLITERLEKVHKGLGEMQALAKDVGDLKKVLSNVKTRGTLGEVQLGTILEQILSPTQYIKNAAVKEGTRERVEFAIKLPGKGDDDKPVLLPIDSKFPLEDYERLIDAYNKMHNLDPKEVESIAKQFENSVKRRAKEIKDKYINPPITTDFAIMFVPTEGLYAEILRRPGLFEYLQRDLKITVVGPVNLAAFLSSLQMGFKTLAIQKRSSEVWALLAAIKTEFGKFGEILKRTKKKLQEAANVIEEAGVRSRAIERKLKDVQELPENKAIELLGEDIDIDKD